MCRKAPILAQTCVKLIGCPDLANRRWIFEQYDSQVGADTLQKSGGDAAVVRIHGTQKALAISTDCNPRYCYADPYEGGKQAVAETYRNLSARLARKPLAITNCLNFANPQRPEIMAQIVQALEGMGDACRALDYPIVSRQRLALQRVKGDRRWLCHPANTCNRRRRPYVSTIMMMTTIAFKHEGDAIWLVGGEGTHLGQSLYLREIAGREAGDAPKVDLAVERQRGEQVREWIAAGKLTAVHDISDGGLLVALAEMALASDKGCTLAVEARYRQGLR